MNICILYYSVHFLWMALGFYDGPRAPFVMLLPLGQCEAVAKDCQ